MLPERVLNRLAQYDIVLENSRDLTNLWLMSSAERREVIEKMREAMTTMDLRIMAITSFLTGALRDVLPDEASIRT